MIQRCKWFKFSGAQIRKISKNNLPKRLNSYYIKKITLLFHHHIVPLGDNVIFTIYTRKKKHPFYLQMQQVTFSLVSSSLSLFLLFLFFVLSISLVFEHPFILPDHPFLNIVIPIIFIVVIRQGIKIFRRTILFNWSIYRFLRRLSLYLWGQKQYLFIYFLF